VSSGGGEAGPVRRALVLANPRIGRLQGGVAETLRQHLPASICDVVAVDGPAAMARRAQAAASDGYDRVVVAGGDGSVGVVLRALAGTALPIAIIPMGTYNNFAGSLGIPSDLVRACLIAMQGEAGAVDLARVVAQHPPATFVFKEVLGAGVDAMAFGAGVDVAGPAKIPVGALAALSAVVSFRPLPMRFRCDFARHSVHCTQLLVANTPRYGPAIPIVPEADPRDGWLHVMARTWRGRLDLMRELPQIFRGRHRELEHDVLVRARHVTIRGSPRILIHADGEFFCRLPITVEILPAAARVVLP